MIQNETTCLGYDTCVGEWCSPRMDLLSDLPRDPFRTVKTCHELSHALQPGRVLSVNLAISCSPDYISYYHSVEGIFQIFDGVFPLENEDLRRELSESRVMITFGTSDIKGFSIPLLTLKLDFFPTSEQCSLERIDEHFNDVTPRICGYLADTEVKHLYSIEEIRAYVYRRMTSEVAFRNTSEFRALLSKTDFLRWEWFIQSAPTVVQSDCLMNFRESCAGQAMDVADQQFFDLLNNWGRL